MPRRLRSQADRVRARDELLGGLAAVVALAALVVGRWLGRVHTRAIHPRIIVWLAAVVLVVAGVVACRRLAAAMGHHLTRRSSAQAGGVLRLIANGAGFVVLLFAVLAVLGVTISHLLIGAGVAGILLGIAAQQSLSNLFAALVLLLARPFRVGDHVRIRSGAIGVLDVDIVELGLTYVTVRTVDGVLKIPNSAVLASGIGTLSPASDESA
jgi:small-conductance mechanosensitive channel